MAVANKKAEFPCDIKKAWDTVTSLEQYAWRSDISRIEVLDPGKKFVEYTPKGYATTFTVTAYEPMRRWEFDVENDNMKGHWIGLFSSEKGRTAVDFTEEVTAKRFFMKPLVGSYLKKQQETYIHDLRKVLG